MKRLILLFVLLAGLSGTVFYWVVSYRRETQTRREINDSAGARRYVLHSMKGELAVSVINAPMRGLTPSKKFVTVHIDLSLPGEQGKKPLTAQNRDLRDRPDAWRFDAAGIVVYQNAPPGRTYFFTAIFPYWMIAAAWGLASLAVWIWWLRSRRFRGENICPQCGYDVRATPGKCPECGYAAGAKTE
jgi:hypothetical protein